MVDPVAEFRVGKGGAGPFELELMEESDGWRRGGSDGVEACVGDENAESTLTSGGTCAVSALPVVLGLVVFLGGVLGVIRRTAIPLGFDGMGGGTFGLVGEAEVDEGVPVSTNESKSSKTLLVFGEAGAELEPAVNASSDEKVRDVLGDLVEGRPLVVAAAASS